MRLSTLLLLKLIVTVRRIDLEAIRLRLAFGVGGCTAVIFK